MFGIIVKAKISLFTSSFRVITVNAVNPFTDLAFHGFTVSAAGWNTPTSFELFFVGRIRRQIKLRNSTKVMHDTPMNNPSCPPISPNNVVHYNK